MTSPRSLVLALALLLCPAAVSRADDDPGHSRHGTAFDSGLRQRPWKMEGIGPTHFPITSQVPEVQEWFDQGNTLLHSFWFEEAERSFRWCLKLDPDCAMAYWGLARCGLNWFTRGPLDPPELKRYLDFLNEASRRKASVNERERRYIEAWEAAFTGESFTLDGKERASILAKRLQQLALQFPDDLEARALFALFSIDAGHALSTELVLQQILAKEPDHPGAHHYRIHNWDGAAPEQGLPSCLRYGLVAPNIGHADHMPGHNYTKMGLWHEAARSMDSATRVELRYMNQQLALPFETWNYAHNRNYLCWIQEQLGLADASLQGARDLLAAPRDPEANKDNSYGAFDQGMVALVRGLLKFERWDDVLTTSNSVAIPWRDIPSDKELRAFAETLAHIGKGDLFKARGRLQDLKSGLRQRKEAEAAWAISLKSAEGILLAAEGNLLDATRLLTDAAALEQKERAASHYANDPPNNPWPLNRVLGDVYLHRGEHRLAVEAYQRALAQEPYDAFTLSGLARAHFALGERAKAEHDYGRLLYVWSGANANLRWLKDVAALGLKAAPVAPTLAPERPYRADSLAALGPLNWEPYAAPKLTCLDVEGKPVSLEQFRGSNVLLVFYLNDECVHCVEQLKAINARAGDWSSENTVVLGVSSVSPEKNKESSKLGKLALRLLSDRDHENARRFASYDDFEELELHSTILIDTQGRVHWKRTGGKPFADVEFLLQSVKRMNQSATAQPKAPRAAVGNQQSRHPVPALAPSATSLRVSGPDHPPAGLSGKGRVNFDLATAVRVRHSRAVTEEKSEGQHPSRSQLGRGRFGQIRAERRRWWRHLRQRGGESAQVLEHVADQAVNERSALFREPFGKLWKTEAWIVEGMDETAHHIDAFPQCRLEGAETRGADVLVLQCVVDALSGEFSRTQRQVEARRVDGIEKRTGVADHHPAVATGLAIEVGQVA